MYLILKTAVFGSGLVAVDHIFRVDKKNRTVCGSKYLGSAGGGSVPNMLCLLSLLGHDSSVFGITGNDLAARIVEEEFRLFGIDCSSVVKRGKRDLVYTRQYSHEILSNGKHNFKTFCFKCNSKFSREYQISKLDVNRKVEEKAKKSSLFLFDRANQATYNLADMAKTNGKIVVYDLGFTSYGHYLKTTDNILRLCDLVKVNKKIFDKIMNGSDSVALMKWRERYPNIKYLLITDGANGVTGYARLRNEKVLFDCKAIHCDHTRDAGGAGDIFLGMAIDQLLLNEPPSDLETFKERINLCQALASLSCTLYGARALQRVFLNQKLSRTEILDIAEDIKLKKHSGNSISSSMGLPDEISPPYRLARFNGCDVCGAILKDKRRKLTRSKPINKPSRSNINESLMRAPWTMKSSYESGKTCRYIVENIIGKNSLIVGSGGSFTAAVFGEAIYLHSLSKIAKAITPFEFEGLEKVDPDTVVWLISHGGANTDILGAALNAQKMGHKNVVVLTGSKNSKLSEMANENNWKSVFIQSQERNFVSIIGLLSQVSSLCGLLFPDNELKELDRFFTEDSLRTYFNSAVRETRSISNQIVKSPQTLETTHLVSFARGWGWPALVDLESKIVEGGICTIEISELKNFTHGRYINLFGHPNRRTLVLATPKDDELVNFLYKKFRRYVPTFVMQTDEDGPVGGLILMIKVLFLTYYLGQISKKDILKPRFPPQARGLYSWEPDDRKGRWKK